MEGIKVIMAALAGVFLAAVLKSVKSEMTMLVAAGVSVLILFYILSGLSVIVEQLKCYRGTSESAENISESSLNDRHFLYDTACCRHLPGQRPDRSGGATGGVLQDHDCRTGYAGGAYII